jgi:hypothetical protein
MRFRQPAVRAVIALSALGVVAVPGATSAVPGVAPVVPAHALSHEECNLRIQQLCLDNWNLGGLIQAGQQGWPNENFGWGKVPRCNGRPIVLDKRRGDIANCPFATEVLDFTYWHDTVFSFVYKPTRRCIGSNGSGRPLLTSCPDFTTGQGGGTGVIQVRNFISGQCQNRNELTALNRYESDARGHESFLKDAGYVGGLDYYSTDQSWTCWVSANH